MRSREIIEEINESINSSVTNNMSKLQCYQNNLQSSELDISLISEVQSEFDKNCSMSIDNKESIQCSMINLKCSKFNFVGYDESQREFPCYNESDVMKFINIKPDILPQNLVRGDNDEDTDNEDLENCTKYAYFELLKSLRLEMKLKAANSLQNIL